MCLYCTINNNMTSLLATNDDYSVCLLSFNVITIEQCDDIRQNMHITLISQIYHFTLNNENSEVRATLFWNAAIGFLDLCFSC